MIAPFLCLVVGVHDGDTLRCADGQRVRIAAIDAPEIDTRDGPASQQALSRLALGQRASCDPIGRSYQRVVAWCSIAGRDVSCEMVRERRAYIWARFDWQHRLDRCTR